jgi:leader peptidase (prepilin peptidase)/N-methyltransferase
MALVDLLQSNHAFLVMVTAVLGLMVGSFLNVVIHRLPVMMEREWRSQCNDLLELETSSDNEEDYSLIRPRSRCPDCGHQISALENIPVFSYLALRGRCSECGTRISPRYPLIEMLTAILSGIVAWHFGYGWPLAAALVFTWSMIPLSVIDLEHQLLPDAITLPVLWAGLVLSLFGVFVDSTTSIIGTVAGYLSLWTVYQVFRLITGKQGMGFGDFKLLALCGAWMGWQALPAIIVLSSLVGAVVGISLILVRGRDRNLPIPFGPYLAAAGWLALLWGDQITQTYLRFAGL